MVNILFIKVNIWLLMVNIWLLINVVIYGYYMVIIWSLYGYNNLLFIMVKIYGYYMVIDQKSN